MKSHRRAQSLLGAHFVKAGRLTPEMGRLASHMQRDREDADYDPGDPRVIEASELVKRFAMPAVLNLKKLLGQ